MICPSQPAQMFEKLRTIHESAEQPGRLSWWRRQSRPQGLGSLAAHLPLA
jgi:hypothetical protein